MSTQDETDIAAEVGAQFGEGMADIGARPGTELPKMKGSFKITNAWLSRSQTSGRKQLEAETEILASDAGDEFVGKKYTKRWGLESEENMQWLNSDMLALGLEEPKSKEGLLALSTTLIGICFNASLVPNKDEAFPPNMFINRGARREDLEGEGSGKPSRF